MTGHQRERQAQLKDRFAQLLNGGAAAAPEKTPPARPRPRKTPAKTSPPQPMPRVQAETDQTRPRRLMVPLSVDEDRALKEYRLQDGIAAAARVRAMLALYREDERLRRRVDAMAKRMR